MMQEMTREPGSFPVRTGHLERYRHGSRVNHTPPAESTYSSQRTSQEGGRRGFVHLVSEGGDR